MTGTESGCVFPSTVIVEASILAAGCPRPSGSPQFSSSDQASGLIARVVTSLQPPLATANAPSERWNVTESMTQFSVPAVSVAVINDNVSGRRCR